MKEFTNFDGIIPEDNKRYFLLGDGDILEVGVDHEMYDNPFVRGDAYGKAHGYSSYQYSGSTRDSAINALEKDICNESLGRIDLAIEDFLRNDMTIKETVNDGEVSKEIQCPSIILWNLEMDEEDNTLSKEDLFDKYSDYIWAYGHPDGGHTFDEMSLSEKLGFCKEHDIDISDYLLIADIRHAPSQTEHSVIVMDIDDVRAIGGTRYADVYDLSVMSDDQKERVLDEQVRMFDAWAQGDVYYCATYDKSGSVTDFAAGFYGQNEITSEVNWYEGNHDVRIVADLGAHRNIKECMEANRKDLEKSNDIER